MTETRICAYVACEVEFEPRRPHQRFHAEECRYAQWVLDNEDSGHGSSQRVGRATRRSSRDGKGTKVYLTRPELIHLQSARNFQKVASTPLGDRLDAKLNRAIERTAA